MVFLDLMLDGSGRALPERATVKSPAAISRFLNHASWDTRKLCRMLRKHALQALQSLYRQNPGRLCCLNWRHGSLRAGVA